MVAVVLQTDGMSKKNIPIKHFSMAGYKMKKDRLASILKACGEGGIRTLGTV